jgi:hypothetical protein
MRSRLGLFEKTCLCRGGQPPEELNLRTVIDECFFVERVSENIEEIGNFQRILSENFAVSWIERFPQMSGCRADAINTFAPDQWRLAFGITGLVRR